MDNLFICRDGLFDSLISNIGLAISVQKSGKAVGVLFTGDALYRLCNGVIRYPDSLGGVEVRKVISAGSDQMGLSLHPPRDPKGISIKPLLLQAKEAGVLLYACPIWTKLLKLSGKLPEELSEISMEKLVDEINSPNKIIGGL